MWNKYNLPKCIQYHVCAKKKQSTDELKKRRCNKCRDTLIK